MPGDSGSTTNGPTTEREAGIVYAVQSRRSRGLSVGIDLFPDGKRCSFDCPYCEIHPFAPAAPFSADELERQLSAFFRERLDTEFPGTPVRDICISGSGEPTLSPHLEAALYAAAAARGRWCPDARLVLITNSSGFVSAPVFGVLDSFANKVGLYVWAKLDAGTDSYYHAISRSAVPFRDILDGILRWGRLHPLIIQTMFCSIDGKAPDGGQLAAYGARVGALLDQGADISEVHLYTQARPSASGRTAPLSDAFLSEAARSLREASSGRVIVRVFGARGSLD